MGICAPFFIGRIRYEETINISDSAEIKLSKLVDIKKAEKEQIHSLPPPKKCGMCSKDLMEEKYYVDGALKRSEAWANMCPKCFFEHGKNIGWGEGQLYMQETKGSWLLVAGFESGNDNPHITEGYAGRIIDMWLNDIKREKSDKKSDEKK